jgi:nucleotide-binding universal stress UspA family protein
VVDGVACEVIIKSCRTYEADLLVLGTHGVHRGLNHLLIGSNTERILLEAECPILTIGAHVLSGFDIERNLREILYYSDSTPEAAHAAPYALFLGEEFNVPVDLCQLLPSETEQDTPSRTRVAENYCESLKKTLQGARPEWCTPPYQLERGMELKQLIQRAESLSAGLIVLGVRAESQLGRHLHTSFAYQVLTRANCPVFSVLQKPRAE